MISRENLELGCKLIKEAVIEKALAKVRDDLDIIAAIKKREEFFANNPNGERRFYDESQIAQFQDLPQ